MNILREIKGRFHTVLVGYSDAPETLTALIRPVQDAKHGDYQANFAMPLAKQRGVNPLALAKEIADKVALADLCEPPEVAGAGFINLRLKTEWITTQVTAQAHDARCGVNPVPAPRKYIVDYSSPNVAKPMHVGHLRSSVIGDALYRVLKFLGHDVTSDNHIGDWGTQFGMIIYGYKHFLDAAAYAANPVGELARLYRLVNLLEGYHEAAAELPGLRDKLADVESRNRAAQQSPVPADKKEQEARKKSLKQLAGEQAGLSDKVSSAVKKLVAVEGDATLLALARQHPGIAEEARLETSRMHAGDSTNIALWNQFMPECLAALGRMYDRLGVRFDIALGESHYQPMLASVVEDLKAAGLAVESDGAICVFIPGVDAPFIIRKRDGAYTYATSDLATIRDRVDRLKADVVLYVVDARQGDHFKLLFETARRWGYDKVDLRHVSFGTILGDDRRPFKTRSGDTVGLESLIDEAVARARKIVDDNESQKPQGAELDEATRTAISESVGIGAIKYADLSQNRETDYVFSWDKMLALSGDTATYMQYAYARVCGIFRRGEIDRVALRQRSQSIRLEHPAERALALQLARFHETLDGVVVDYRPNLLTNYLFETANCFSTFFENCPVLKADNDESRASRLLLADLTARTIGQGLSLLGIETIEKM
ncbi:MAG: arginine--tRNA ligase [Planctomycetota bacterium]|nr:arginine--tRNA ligase [Planctomycetota bacterium]